ncbi:MAG: hypothetical protein IKE55_12935 [Kiritimatiellae bacterium]|nr:hypothetical protein [Kiritimatiellia bacterium]
MKKFLAICASAAMPMLAQAADQSLTWTSGATPATLGDGGELAFTYADGKVQTLSATVAVGDTITLGGDAIDFAANAVVAISGPGNFVVENALVGENGLAVTNAQDAAVAVYNGGLLNYGANAAFKTMFPGCDIDDVTVLYANNRAFTGIGNPQILYPYLARRFTTGGVKMMTLQMQISYRSSDGKDITKTSMLELRQSGADVQGRIRAGYYPWAKLEGEDMENLYRLWQSNPDTNVNTEVLYSGGYNVCNLSVMWTGAPRVSLRGDLSGLGGPLKVARGASADILGATAAPPSSSVSGQLIAGDANLTIDGTMAGDDFGTLVLAATKPGSYTVTLSKTYLNRVSSQVGQHLRDVSVADMDRYGRLVIKGDSAAGKTMTCRVLSNAAFPANGVVEVRDGGVLDMTGLDGKGSPNRVEWQNDSAKIRVYRGGVVRHYNNWTTSNEQKIELCGGTFESQRASGVVTYSYQNRMLFEDGASLASKGGTFWAGNSSTPSWKVRGTSPSSMDAPLQVLGLGNGNLAVMVLDVADVTGDDRPDFVFRGSITPYAQSGTFSNGGINKLGIGTALMMGAFSLNSGLAVSCGTMVLGISNGWTGTGALTLGGGTFAVSNDTVNAIPAVLKVNPRGGTIHLGENARLSFADSSGEDGNWNGVVTVSGFREGALRFGASGSALTERQIGLLRTSEGKKLSLFPDGYVTANRGLVLKVR